MAEKVKFDYIASSRDDFDFLETKVSELQLIYELEGLHAQANVSLVLNRRVITLSGDSGVQMIKLKRGSDQKYDAHGLCLVEASLDYVQLRGIEVDYTINYGHNGGFLDPRLPSSQESSQKFRLGQRIGFGSLDGYSTPIKLHEASPLGITYYLEGVCCRLTFVEEKYTQKPSL